MWWNVTSPLPKMWGASVMHPGLKFLTKWVLLLDQTVPKQVVLLAPIWAHLALWKRWKYNFVKNTVGTFYSICVRGISFWKAATTITLFLSLSHSALDHGMLCPLSKTVSLPYPHNWENVFKQKTSRWTKDLLVTLNELYFLKYLEQYQMHQGKGLKG